jgi:glycine cleavage system H protein
MTLDEFIEGLPDDYWYCPHNDTWIKPQTNAWVLGANAFVTTFGKFMVFYPKPDGSVFDRGESLGVMETWKTAFGIAAPFSCAIQSSNGSVVKDINLIKDSPYGAGWLFVLRPTGEFDPSKSFLQKPQYVEWLRGPGRKQFDHLLPSNDPSDLIYDPLRGV